MGDAGGGVHGGEQEHQEPVDRIGDVDPVDTAPAHRDGDLIAGVECLKDSPLSGRAQVVDAAGAGHAVRGASSCPQFVVRNQAVQSEPQVLPRVVTKYGLMEKVPVLRSKSPSVAT